MADGGRRLPAADIEQLVSERVRLFLYDKTQLSDVVQSRGHDAPTEKRMLDNATQLARGWQDRSHGERRAMLLDLIDRVEVHRERVDVHLRPARLVGRLLGDATEPRSDGDDAKEEDCRSLSVPARYKRAGIEMKLIVDGPANHRHRGQADTSIVKLVVKAHQLRDLFIHSNGQSFKELAKQQGINPSYFTRLIRLTFLAPDITQSLLEGRHPVELTAARLMRNTRFPLDWQTQRRLLGFG